MKAESSRLRRIFIALVNLTDNSMMIQEGDPDAPYSETKFKMMACPPGALNLRAYVVSAEGQIERTAKDLTLTVQE